MKEEIITNESENNVFAIDKFSFTRPTPKTHVLEVFAAQWSYVLYFVIAGVILCARSECDFNMNNLVNVIPLFTGKIKVYGIIAAIACFLNWFTPLLIVLMLNAIGKYNTLLQPKYQISNKSISAAMYLQFILMVCLMVSDSMESDIMDILGGLVAIVAIVCLTIMACKMRKTWIDTDEDLVAIGHTWFVYAIGTIVMLVLSMILGCSDNFYLSYVPDILFVIMDIYLFSKMEDQLENISILFKVERNQYVLDHSSDFSEDQVHEAEAWQREVQLQTEMAEKNNENE